MSGPSLNALRTEHQEQGIGPLLLGVLRSAVRNVCADYSPELYARSSTWDDEALEEVLQRWTLERLLGRGNLAQVVASSVSIGALHSMLRQSLRWHLAAEHAKGERHTMARRVRQVLSSSSSFRRIGGRGGDVRWTTTAADASRLDAVALARIASWLSDQELQVVERPTGTRASPLLPTDQLERVVQHVLAAAEGSVTFAELVDALALRFGIFGGGRDALPPPDVVDSSDPGSEAVERETERVRSAVARDVADGLGPESRLTVVAWADDPSFAHVAARLGIHPSTVRSRLEGVFATLMERGFAAGLLMAVDDGEGHMKLDGASWEELRETAALLGELLRESNTEA